MANLARRLGPALITGVSADDPSGNATYAQAGSRCGYSMGWTLLFAYPLICDPADQRSKREGSQDVAWLETSVASFQRGYFTPLSVWL